MNTLLKMIAGIVVVVPAIGIAFYQVDQSVSANTSETIRINVNNTIDGLISNITQENRQGVVEVITPLVIFGNLKLIIKGLE
ncbi:MAG: hypothetical protein KZQ76_02940 [Candidatus Thiodiazotropha sp. (ex Epidulcina cf. delphinae)]|nr:hypothetical protein [Candidatus Thiodiazotropha sp. (ex Epidulcina cf. delphinae)]